MNVYVCTTGSYSEYEIKRIFSKQEKAEEWFANQHDAWHDPQWVVWEVDKDQAGYEGGKLWFYQVDSEGATITPTTEEIESPFVKGKTLHGTVYANTEEEATKLATELYQWALRREWKI
ncbi:MAG: hypothetical protein OEN50_18270 [Deltaproteobacteria bacterium]|nr:hypothetical protein [Deltaproteobacteria bacterium]